MKDTNCHIRGYCQHKPKLTFIALGETIKYGKILLERQNDRTLLAEHQTVSEGQSPVKTHMQTKSRNSAKMTFILWDEKDEVEVSPNFSTKPERRSWKADLGLASLNSYWAGSTWHLKKSSFNTEIQKLLYKYFSLENHLLALEIQLSISSSHQYL